MENDIQYQQTYSDYPFSNENRKFKMKKIYVAILFLLVLVFGYLFFTLSSSNKNKISVINNKHNLTVEVKFPQFADKVQVFSESSSIIKSPRKPNGEISQVKPIAESAVPINGFVVFSLDKGNYFINVIINNEGIKYTHGYFIVNLKVNKDMSIEIVPFL